MQDVFTPYETGLHKLFGQIASSHPRYTEALTLQSRLVENIAHARHYGDTETRRADRAQIVDALNALVLEILDTSFNELCNLGAEHSVAQPGASSTIGVTGKSFDLFISYSHIDEVWVWDELLPQLEGAGLRVCIDQRDFQVGVSTLVNIERAVDSSRHTLIVLTPAWVGNEWTEFEGLLVGSTDPAGRRGKLLPLKLRYCKLPGRIAMLHSVDLTKPSTHVNQIDQLIRQVQVAPSVACDTQDPPKFIAGPPITDPQCFFGRNRELGRLFDLWKGLPLQNAAIIGPRRSGKTSLLLYLKNITVSPSSQLRPGQRRDWLRPPERCHWIFVDFQDPRMGKQEKLLRYLLTGLNLPMPTGSCDIERFIDVVSRALHSRAIILLDEMDVALQRYPELDNTFWEGLRALATNQVGGNLAFVLASREPPDQLASHSNIGSPFFNIFGYTAWLGPLTELEARELIAGSPIPFSDTDVDWILAQSGCWPLLLQILCRERLAALKCSETGDAWQAEGLQQMSPFMHCFEQGEDDVTKI